MSKKTFEKKVLDALKEKHVIQTQISNLRLNVLNLFENLTMDLKENVVINSLVYEYLEYMNLNSKIIFKNECLNLISRTELEKTLNLKTTKKLPLLYYLINSTNL